MSGPQVIEISQRVDVQCWHEAIQLHNNGLQNNPSDKNYIHLDSQTVVNNKQSTSEDLMKTALSSYQGLNHKRSHFAECLMRIYKTLHRHAKAVDVFVQSDPTISSLVWGSVRLILQFGEDSQRASKIAGEGVLQILHHVSLWEQISEVAIQMKSPKIRETIVQLYVKVLDFLVCSIRWMNKSSLKRLRSSILDSKADKLDEKLSSMRFVSELLDKELQIKVTRNNIDSLGEISSDIQGLRGTMDRIDSMLQQVQHLSGPATQAQLSSLLTSQDTNKSAVAHVLKELQSLPFLITNSVLEQVKETNNLTDIKRWLSSVALEGQPVVSRTKGTCEWILNHSSYTHWNSNDTEHILWVQGYPGTGKSVTATFIRDTLSNQGCSTLFYQFRRSACALNSSPTTFACSLVFQLLSANDTYPFSKDLLDPIQQLQGLMTQHPQGPQSCSFGAMWGILSSLLVALKILFRIVIDAMDECSFSESSQPHWSMFSGHISHLVQKTGSKVIIFSRPEPMFSHVVGQSEVICLHQDLLLPDILKLAEQLCDEFQIPQSTRKAAMDRVKAHSNGSFRWTWLFLDYLGRSLLVTDLDVRLKSQPPSLYNLYTAALVDSTRQLDRDELECQKSIFQLAFNVQRALKPKEVASALGLQPEKVERIISKLCQPFIACSGGSLQFTHPSVREYFESYDESGDPASLGISFSDGDALMAKLCLTALLDNKYSALDRIGHLLLTNYSSLPKKSSPLIQDNSDFYEYASRYWDYHLIQARSRSHELTPQLQEFLDGLPFTHWAEYSLHDAGQFVCVCRAYNRVQGWRRKNSRSHLRTEGYFESSYNRLIADLEHRDKDGTLQWLARMSLGNYFFITVAESKASNIREQVAEGLQCLLGPENALSLRSRTDLAYTCLYSAKMRAARRIYTKVLIAQERLLGKDHASTLETLVYRGESEFFMADFPIALVTFTTVMSGFLKLMGAQSWQYLGAQWWYANTLAQMGEFQAGLDAMEIVAQARRDQFGDDDTFYGTVQIGIGEVLRLLDRSDESVPVLEKAVVALREEYEMPHIFRLDVEIALAMSYLGSGRTDDAMQILQSVEKDGRLEDANRFERACQVAHLKALVLSKQGHVNDAIDLLQSTIVEAEQDQRNRTLLWIRLDVADLLRSRNNEGDHDQASANFDSIVRDISGNEEPGFPDEPDPPKLLAIAEHALRLMRARKYGELYQELEAGEVDWVHSSDFWLRIGGAYFWS